MPPNLLEDDRVVDGKFSRETIGVAGKGRENSMEGESDQKSNEIPLLQSGGGGGNGRGTASAAQTLGNIIVSIVGTGVLGLPFAFRVAGWLAGSLGVLIAGVSTYYCMLLLVRLFSPSLSFVMHISLCSLKTRCSFPLFSVKILLVVLFVIVFKTCLENTCVFFFLSYECFSLFVYFKRFISQTQMQFSFVFCFQVFTLITNILSQIVLLSFPKHVLSTHSKN